MAEALSQSQIDELLKKMHSGAVEEPQDTGPSGPPVKEYDFSSPRKFTKDQLKSLNNLYENFGRILSSYLTGIMHSVCEINIVQIEEQRYFEFNNALADNTLVGMIGFNPTAPSYDESTIMFELPTSLGFLLIDRMMGGTGKLNAPDRDYTDIELSMLNIIYQNISRYMQEAWSNFFPLKTSLRSIETNGRMLQAYSQQDIVLIITLEISDASYTGTANVCMLAENLEGVIDSFSVKYSHPTKTQDPERENLKRDVMMRTLQASDLRIDAILNRCTMKMSDIAGLQVGDVIALNQKIDSSIAVDIEGIPWYTARLGEANEKKAIKIVDTIAK